MTTLEGRTMIITGGAGNNGLAIVRMALEAGMNVAFMRITDGCRILRRSFIFRVSVQTLQKCRKRPDSLECSARRQSYFFTGDGSITGRQDSWISPGWRQGWRN